MSVIKKNRRGPITDEEVIQFSKLDLHDPVHFERSVGLTDYSPLPEYDCHCAQKFRCHDCQMRLDGVVYLRSLFRHDMHYRCPKCEVDAEIKVRYLNL